MEAIKCPNCGSEKVQGLTEEKYVCLACDNVFLVHNLSKEFRETDAHIADVHEDLKRSIIDIKEAVTTTQTSGELETLLYEAEDSFRERSLESFGLFDKYVNRAPNSYVGHYGKYRAILNMYGNNMGLRIDSEDDYGGLYAAFDELKLALDCEDCDKERVLSEVLKQHKLSALTAIQNIVRKKLLISKDVPVGSLIYTIQNEISDIQGDIKKEQDEISEMHNLSPEQKKTRLIKKAIPVVISVLILLIFIFPMRGFLGIILKIVGVVVVGMIAICTDWKGTTQVSSFYTRRLETLQGYLERAKKVEALSIADMEDVINENLGRGKDAEPLQRAIESNTKRQRQREAEKSEGLWYINLCYRGKSKIKLAGILKDTYGVSPIWITKALRNNDTIRLFNNISKTRALEIQRHLAETCGATTHIGQ